MTITRMLEICGGTEDMMQFLLHCVAEPGSAGQVCIDLEAAEAVLKTTSRAGFYLEIFSSCLESRSFANMCTIPFDKHTC